MTRPRNPALPSLMPQTFLGAGKLSVEDNGAEMKLLAGLPHERPTTTAGDTLSVTVRLRRAVDFRACGNH